MSADWLIEHSVAVIRQTVQGNRWMRRDLLRGGKPHPKQLRFLAAWEQEALMGGAAGGGKTLALLMGALQYVDVPHYKALILRRYMSDLEQPGGIVEASKQWLSGTQARWSESHRRWTFPSGAVIKFSHCNTEADKLQYRSGEYHYIAFEELTEFTQTMYEQICTRLRKPVYVNVPLRVRSATNPGGIGHDWVKKRFVTGESLKDHERGNVLFVPARLEDNPSLDADEYDARLRSADSVTYQQLRYGDWDIAHTGGVFDPEGIQWQRQFLASGRSGMLVA